MSELKDFDINEFKIGQNLYIEASAGTGKTYTIELLVKKMLQNNIPLSKILIVTFTDKAAGELRDRIRKKIISCLENDSYNSIFTTALQEVGNAQIFTFHSFCQNVLNNFAYETKSSLNLELVNDNNIEDIVDRFIRDKWQKISDFKKLLCFSDFKLDDLKSECINAVKQYNLFTDLKIEEIDIKKDDKKLFEDKFVLTHFHELIDEWQNYKKNNNLISFADMINLVHENVCKNNSILVDRLREAYRYAIIDEFQDTNQKQWDIFGKIFLDGKNNNIIVVGDPKQSIFSFQGAEIDVYKKAIDKIGNGRRLSSNYRSSDAMIKACNEIFNGKKDNFFGTNSGIELCDSIFPVHNEDSDKKTASLNGRIVEPIWLAKPSDGLEYAKYAVSKMVECLKCDENGKTALQIYDKNENQMRSVKFSDFAVLARTRSEMPFIENEMRNIGIPFYRYKDTS
ncbi:MAG: UvrD-helicase domain-containing protein, partial [Candidatus Riflebacteria bacterium]|nr:UvrD-helicase domain-containing protein [Candidatus Riflebacteria bacterium]